MQIHFTHARLVRRGEGFTVAASSPLWIADCVLVCSRRLGRSNGGISAPRAMGSTLWVSGWREITTAHAASPIACEKRREAAG